LCAVLVSGALLAVIVFCRAVGRSGLAAVARTKSERIDNGSRICPTRLDPDKTLVWSTPVSGESAASPVVADGKVFVSTIDANKN